MFHEFEVECPLCEGPITVTYEQDGPEAIGVTVTSKNRCENYKNRCENYKTVQAFAERKAQDHLNDHFAGEADRRLDSIREDGI